MSETEIPVTAQLFPIEIEDEIQELERELRLRKVVYPEFVSARRLSQAKADRQIAVLESAIGSLHRLKGLG